MNPSKRIPLSVVVAPGRPGVWRLMLRWRIACPALKVALVVGTVLNAVNNGEQLWLQHSVDLWRVALNFVVPYCVASYSAARNEARRPLNNSLDD